MNIQYRHLSDLTINVASFEKRLEFYQSHYYDNIYFISEEGKYLGFRSYQTEILGKKFNIEPIQYGLSVELIYDWFLSNPGLSRLPAIKGNVFCGEYYDASLTGQILYKDIEDRSLEIFPVFKNDINELYTDKKVGVLGKEIANILDVFPMAEEFNNLRDYDLIINTNLIPQFIDLMGNRVIGMLSPSEILLPILIDKVIDYFKKSEVNFLIVNGIMKKSLNNATEVEKERLNMTLEQVLQDSEYVYRFCGEDSKSYKKLCQHKHDLNQFVKVFSNGVCNVLLDKIEENYNIIEGRRLTVGVPHNASQKIHMFGPCAVMGLCVVDEMTICSLLQHFINQERHNAAVCNHGLAYGNDKLNDLLSMMDEPVRNGDCIIWFSAFEKNDLVKLQNKGVPILEVRECVDGLIDWFLDNPFHCNAQANFNIAEAIFVNLRKSLRSLSSRNRYSMVDSLKIKLQHNPYAIMNSKELNAYAKYIEQFKCDEHIKTKGAVVLNANPCTLGHMYLIKEALQRVDFLYIFLVEECIGNMPYMDREYMLKESLKYNKRVRVIRGGSIMTSEKVFPEYFNKSTEPSKINLVLTHKVFGKIVGSILGVTYRFFGTEPKDKVTRALNESASEILPKYGIQPIFIERMSIDGKNISANNARDLFYSKQYTDLAKIVPLSTFRRLLEIAHDYDDNFLTLYYANADYSALVKAISNGELLSINEFDLRKNSYCYPGKFEKYGCEYAGQEWILKIAHNENQELSLSSEKFGQTLCKQMHVPTSEIVPILYDGFIAQLSKNWKNDDGTQFFPLAAYYEELLDHKRYEGGITFKYKIFEQILKAKCHKRYNDILTILWRVFIIDYLLCNTRSAGNIGFIDDGTIRLSPIYDNSTCLESMGDTRFMSIDFPCLLMEFDLDPNSAYNIFRKFNNKYLTMAVRYAKEHINLCDLYEIISSKEDCFLFDVIEYRFLKLFD